MRALWISRQNTLLYSFIIRFCRTRPFSGTWRIINRVFRGTAVVLYQVYRVFRAYGNVPSWNTKTSRGIAKFGLSSNMYDNDTGLYYFVARWYDPHAGRFLEMDPVLSESGLMNMYDYCGNNPVNNMDRYG